MSLILNEEQVQLQDSAKSFVADNWTVGELRKMRAATGKGYSETLWAKVAELGWLVIPENGAMAASTTSTPSSEAMSRDASWPPVESCVWK